MQAIKDDFENEWEWFLAGCETEPSDIEEEKHAAPQVFIPAFSSIGASPDACASGSAVVDSEVAYGRLNPRPDGAPRDNAM